MRQYLYLENPETKKVVEESFYMPLGAGNFKSVALSLKNIGRNEWLVKKAFTVNEESEAGKKLITDARLQFGLPNA